MLWSAIVGGLLDKVAPKVADHFRVKMELEHEKELEQIRGKIEYEKAKTRRAEMSEGRDHEWELEQIRNSGWKDEWILILLSIPLVLVFIPQTQVLILDGFVVLSNTPDWYRWLILIVFTAVFGVRIWRRSVDK
jgi:cation transport ATPase